ncbi:MAG: Uma2 family endonuclease [Caldilineaceae bacterium]
MSILDKTIKEVTAEYEVRLHMSYDEWRAQVADSKQSEWVDGEVIIFMPPSIRHQDISTFLAALLKFFVDHFQLGKVISAPVEMRATYWGNAREPDILFVSHEHADRFDEMRLAGAADLVVEVISPESVRRDTYDKFHEYEAAGVTEYWIIDARPGYAEARFWVLDESGHYREVEVDAEGIYHSTVLPNFWISVDWLWPESQPSPLLAFAEIVGLSKETIDLLRSLRKK